jgi:CelD/BcsL family acetyltransferase involved in cellulose biosynthesis
MNIKTIRSLQELEAMQTYWERWQDHPNNDFSQFGLVCQLRPEVEYPCVTVIERNHQPHALLAGRMERTQFAPPLGYFTPVKIPAKVMNVLHQGSLGGIDEEISEALVPHLWSLLAAGEADAVAFYKLTEDSPLLRALQMHSSPWWCEKKLVWHLHWQTLLPDEPGVLLKDMKSKHRSLIRKRERSLESAFPGQVSWRWISRFDDIPEFCAQLEAVAARTYQRGLESGFINNEDHRRRFALFANRGQLRAQVLEIDGQIRAFDVGIIYNDTFFGSETGFDPDLRDFAPGTLVMLRMIDELIQEGVRKVDWGLGDAHYKQQFGNHSWLETTVWLFAPTAKGLALRSMLRLSILADTVARQVLKKMGLTDKLKSLWRRRVTKGEAEQNNNENAT